MSLYSAAEYGQALAALRPRGRAWPQDPNSQQVQTFDACGASLARLDAAAQALLVDAFPATTVDVLPEWEASLGLPDLCVGPGATTSQRQAQVVARFTSVGGQSRQAFIDYAAAIGFEITITTFAPFRCGIGACGDPLSGPEWAFAWGVSVNANTGGFSNDVLLCELQALKPAETTVFLLD